MDKEEREARSRCYRKLLRMKGYNKDELPASMTRMEGHFRFQHSKQEFWWMVRQCLWIHMGEVHHNEDVILQMFRGVSRGHHKPCSGDFHYRMGEGNCSLLIFYFTSPLPFCPQAFYIVPTCFVSQKNVFSTLKIPVTWIPASPTYSGSSIQS